MDEKTPREATPANRTRRLNVGRIERAASVAAAALLITSAVRTLGKKPVSASIKLLTGGYLLYRGSSGYCPLYDMAGVNNKLKQPAPLFMRDAITVNRPRTEVYEYWRDLQRLPLFMKHLHNVTVLSEHVSHWEMLLPGKTGPIEWDAVIIEDKPGRLLRWRSQPESDIDTTGEVLFRDAPGNRGTEVHVSFYYRLPEGMLGKLAGKVAHPITAVQLHQDLQRFKQMMETGEVATIEGQAAARKQEAMLLNP